jgi:hypothetical protein
MREIEITKKLLRAVAHHFLESRGYDVARDKRRGAAPGARLIATRGAEKLKIAVRTSKGREVGLLRRVDGGGWRTVPEVDEVVVAVKSRKNHGNHTSIEVLGFDPDTLVGIFDAVTKGKKMCDSDTPVFIALDEKAEKGSTSVGVGLRAKAKWKKDIVLNAQILSALPQAEPSSLIERVKREFAELNGVAIDKVIVEFRIIT